MEQSFLSVIIPTLNEGENLPALLADLHKQQGVSLEIIVTDGGSSDATRSVAAAFGVHVTTASRGRGAQMNAAVQAATGDYLFFLHADSRIDDSNLLKHALDALAGEAEGNDAIAGHFALRFLRRTTSNGLAYRYLEEKSTCNRANTTNGDQGFLLTREFFCRLGGFDETLPYLEDQGLAEKIRRQGRWITLPGSLQTSARRFESEGFHRRYILMAIMMGFYSIGEIAFLRRAPGVYRLQEETETLCLSPFFRLIRRMLFEWGGGGTLRIFFRLGRYIRENSWQLFFFIDVSLRTRLGAGRYPFLAFHDRIFGPWTNFRFVDAMTGVLCFVWFLGFLAPFFWLREHFSAGLPSASDK